MIIIYFKTHCNRKAEKIFFDYLKSGYKNITHIDKNYKLPDEYINKLIDTNELFISIETSQHIAEKKKKIIREFLNNLPNKIKVAKNITNLSVDIVIDDNGQLTFIEFHEKQHYRLSDKRLKPIFSKLDERYEIPRFLQRLIKDIWRWENLTNYKIVWQNWFENTHDLTIKFDEKKNEEFVLPNKFSISSL